MLGKTGFMSKKKWVLSDALREKQIRLEKYKKELKANPTKSELIFRDRLQKILLIN
jgi:hypothetical protein